VVMLDYTDKNWVGEIVKLLCIVPVTRTESVPYSYMFPAHGGGRVTAR
jgi:hypothetical protein